MPAPSRRRRAIKIAAALGVALLIVIGAVLLARQVYFLGTDDEGRVALYRGLPYELPLGVDLYSEQRSIGVQASALSEDRQRAVTEHELRSEGDATDLIEDIEQTEGAVAPTPPPPAAKQAAKKRAAKRAARKRAAKKQRAQAP